MRALRRLLDRQARHFEPGGKLHKFHALYEMPDTILFTPGTVTRGTTHVRDMVNGRLVPQPLPRGEGVAVLRVRQRGDDLSAGE